MSEDTNIALSDANYEIAAFTERTERRIRKLQETVELAEGYMYSLRSALIRQASEAGEGVLVDSVVETFDAVSIYLSMPISDERGVPYELLPTPVQAGYKPKIQHHAAGFEVRWGTGDLDYAVFEDLEEAGDRLAECVLEARKLVDGDPVTRVCPDDAKNALAGDDAALTRVGQALLENEAKREAYVRSREYEPVGT